MTSAAVQNALHVKNLHQPHLIQFTGGCLDFIVLVGYG